MKRKILVSMDDDMIAMLKDIAAEESDISCEFVSVSELIRVYVRAGFASRKASMAAPDGYDPTID